MQAINRLTVWGSESTSHPLKNPPRMPILKMGMNVSNIQSSDPVQMTQGLEVKRMQLQMLLLKKSLDAQQTEATALENMLGGKGQNLDIRV